MAFVTLEFADGFPRLRRVSASHFAAIDWELRGEEREVHRGCSWIVGGIGADSCYRLGAGGMWGRGVGYAIAGRLADERLAESVAERPFKPHAYHEGICG